VIDVVENRFMMSIHHRLEMSQEALLWRIALEHFGPTDLLCTIVELWSLAGPLARLTVEHLGDEVLGEEVLSILKIAQIQVGAIVPGREANSAKNYVVLPTRQSSR
jgi:hypothetical protein